MGKRTMAERQVKLRSAGEIDRALMRSGLWHDEGGIVQFPDGSCMYVTRDPRVPMVQAAGSAPDLDTARRLRAESWERYVRGL